MKIRVIIEQDEATGNFSAVCPELNYVASCGETPDEALSYLQEAIALMLEPIPVEHLACTGKPFKFVELAM